MSLQNLLPGQLENYFKFKSIDMRSQIISLLTNCIELETWQIPISLPCVKLVEEL